MKKNEYIIISQKEPLAISRSFRYISSFLSGMGAHNEEGPRCNFWKSLNEFDPCSKSTCDSNNKSIVCLVVKVGSRKGKCITDLCVKPTYPHQKLNYLSAHWYHIKTSVVFNKTLHVSRLFSSEKDFENHEEEMKFWFRKRAYPDDLI